MGPGNRNLDLEWLEDFIALAESGNFSRAAEARAIAQPAFSRHIRGLEEWVGVDLFDRSAHPAALTAAGQRFLPLLEKVLGDLEASRIKARAAHDQEESTLRFAATHFLSLTFFPRWLTGIESQLHIGALQTMSDSSRSCEFLMFQRRVQFVLCHGHENVPGRLDEQEYPMLLLDRDMLLPVSVPHPDGTMGKALHAIGNAPPVPMLAYSEESGLGRIMRAQLRPNMVKTGRNTSESDLQEVFTAHHAVLLKTMALEGRGIAWLPQSLITAELASGALVGAGPKAWNIPVEVRMYRQGAVMSDKAEALWSLAKKQALA
ncbi:LysR family transcriptional regulator [Acidovorax sp. Be4]|uniref:LysR family transcriptional regulator n=1 Tax=Acidovorax bellezanensis TaxID=2976702 RepID=A0ABT2PT32_9BURK|nr:LysR family transcriptional regulator [Acidovorax sp. Be4]MCT9812392.1 LysR family transcriptional regulator [Acidovorax sp. Be4]